MYRGERESNFDAQYEFQGNMKVIEIPNLIYTRSAKKIKSLRKMLDFRSLENQLKQANKFAIE